MKSKDLKQLRKMYPVRNYNMRVVTPPKWMVCYANPEKRPMFETYFFG